MGDLTTLAKVRAFLNKTSNDSDPILALLISQVSAEVESFVGYPLLTVEHDEYYSGNGATALFPTARPITSVLQLEIDGLAVSSSASYGAEGYVVEPNLVHLRHRSFTVGRRNVRLRYVAGWTDVESLPADLVGAVTETVALRFKERDWVGFKSKSLAGETVTFESNPFSKNARNTFESYRPVALS